MAKGQRYPSESRTYTDERTGARIRQVTNAPAIHQQPYFYIPAYDDAMQRLVFTTNRTGSSQIFVEDRTTGELVQLTDRPDAIGSVFPSHNGQFIYFNAGAALWRVDTETCAEDMVVDYRQVVASPHAEQVRSGGLSLSRDDHWAVVSCTTDKETWMVVVNTHHQTWETILQRESIGHLQFCPDDANLIWYGVSLKDRVWLIQRDGTNNRRLYQRQPGQWITHESWLAGTREVAMVDWPHGILAVHADTGAVRQVTTFNAWHPSSNRDGTMMVTDTSFPDIGLQIFDPRDGIGAPTPLCYPEASCLGDHWKGPFPYEQGPIPIYAPGHTHPHPSFSPDGGFVVYTSDRTGTAQVYEVALPANASAC